MTVQGFSTISHSTTGKIQISRGEDLQVFVRFETNLLYPHLAEVEVSHQNFHYRFTTEVDQLKRGRFSVAATRNTTVSPSGGGQVCMRVHTDRLQFAVIVPVNDVSLFASVAEAKKNSAR